MQTGLLSAQASVWAKGACHVNLTYHRLTHEFRISLAFVAAAILTGSLTAVFWSRLEDSPGVILAYLTAGFLIMAVVHQWQKPSQFILLALGSIIAFPVFAVLHYLGYAAAEVTADSPLISGFFSVIDGVSFLVAVMVAPVAAGIGLVGAIIVWWRQRRNP